MSGLTLEEELKWAAYRAQEELAEKHFFDANQPFFPLGFSVVYRNPGHWDIHADQCPGKASAWRAINPDGFTTAQDGGRERAFRIRGEGSDVSLYDERWDPHRPFPRPATYCKSVPEAMFYVMQALMAEPEQPKE